MTGKEYVELAMRTNDGNATGRIEKAIELLHRPDKPKCCLLYTSDAADE